jgi:hypothetical protein
MKKGNRCSMLIETALTSGIPLAVFKFKPIKGDPMAQQRIAYFALGALFVGALWELRRHARSARQLRHQPKAKPEEVQTWEGEGGALPYTGSQLAAVPTAKRV